MNADDKLEIIKRHVAALMEHFDSVQVFCTKEHAEEESTGSWCWGKGNWFARYGQAHEWLKKTEARSAKEVAQEDDEP